MEVDTVYNDILDTQFKLSWVINTNDCGTPPNAVIDPVVLDGSNSLFAYEASIDVMFVDCSGVTGEGASWSQAEEHDSVTHISDATPTTFEVGINGSGSWIMDINGGSVPNSANDVCGPEVITATSPSGIDEAYHTLSGRVATINTEVTVVSSVVITYRIENLYS